MKPISRWIIGAVLVAAVASTFISTTKQPEPDPPAVAIHPVPVQTQPQPSPPAAAPQAPAPDEPNDLQVCVTDPAADACLDLVQADIETKPVLGTTTFRTLFDRIDNNTDALQGRTPCDGQCEATAYAQLGLLMQRCARTWWGSGHASSLETDGNLDLLALRQAQLDDALFLLEQKWLARECTRHEAALKAVPSILADAGVDPMAEQPSAHQLLNAFAYIERAVELGNTEIGVHYYDSVNRLNRLRLPEADFAIAYQSTATRQAAKARSEHVATVIDRVFAKDTLAGLAIRAQHAYHRYPSLEEAIVFILDEDGMDPVEIQLRDNPVWLEKALEFATYQIAADRLAGIPDEARFSSQGSFLWRGGFVTKLLDANDLEFASARAGALLAEMSLDEPTPPASQN